MGIEFREGSMLITPKNTQTAKKGMWQKMKEMIGKTIRLYPQYAG